jgi:2-keto-4-pentenoate hydratase
MVRAAAVAAALALEVVDSRIADWRIQLVDTIADNASFGGFALGGWSERLLVSPLEATTFTLTRRDEVMVSELGSAVLGGPLLAVAWLADKLSSLGGGLSAGDVVLSGSFGAAVPALAGDEFTLRGGDESPLKVQFVGS